MLSSEGAGEWVQHSELPQTELTTQAGSLLTDVCAGQSTDEDRVGREMAGEEGDSPGCWAESRQGGVLTTGILTGLVKVGIISSHQAQCMLCALLGLSQPLGDPLLLS